MKLLRRLVFANALLLAAAGVAIAFNPPLVLPVRYALGEPYQSLALVHVVAIALAGAALALLLQSLGSLVGEVRRLALGLSLANGMIALMFFFEQVAFDGNWVGWLLMLIALAMAAALLWMARRPLRPGEAEAEIAALKIPDEIRQGLLRQTAEAAAQEERNRLARDLHDSIKQQLFSINVGTAAAQERWERDPEGALKALADVRRSAREAMVEMQAMLHQLRPEALGTAGLVEALREQCEALGYRTGAEVTLELGEPLPDDRMPPGAPEALFRMAQEMMANVARHARARRVHVWLGRQDQMVGLHVEDDGQGFSPGAESSGMGLRNLKERAESLSGHFEAASTPGTGTRTSVFIPFTPPPVESEPALVKTTRDELRGVWGAAGIALILLVLLPSSHLDASIGGIYAVVACVALALWSRWKVRAAQAASPDATTEALSLLRYGAHRHRAALLLVAAWRAPWTWRLAEEGWTGERLAWLTVALLCAGAGVLELARLYRWSEPRRSWRTGWDLPPWASSRIFWLVLTVVLAPWVLG